MQQKRILPGRLYQISNIDQTEYSKKVWERKEKLDKMKGLLAGGCEEPAALKALDLTKSTYHRWKKRYKEEGLIGLEDQSKKPHNTRKSKWTREIEQRVYHLRKKYPLLGKAKIAVMYKRAFGEKLSISTAGRILYKLIKQNKVMPVRFLYGKRDTKRRIFNGHSKRWKFGMKAAKPGELIQVDHMTVDIPGFGPVKHFNAVCPTTKYAVYQAYKEATSKNAADFLEHMKKEFPFPILSIQVDGGGEFMAEFEKATAMSNIPLWVLPPRKPKYNGTVERGNGTAKYEFYSQYDAQPSLFMINKNLQKFAHYYNKIRPHQGIDQLTPHQFCEVINRKALKSHMS